MTKKISSLLLSLLLCWSLIVPASAASKDIQYCTYDMAGNQLSVDSKTNAYLKDGIGYAGFRHNKNGTVTLVYNNGQPNATKGKTIPVWSSAPSSAGFEGTKVTSSLLDSNNRPIEFDVFYPIGTELNVPVYYYRYTAPSSIWAYQSYTVTEDNDYDSDGYGTSWNVYTLIDPIAINNPIWIGRTDEYYRPGDGANRAFNIIAAMDPRCTREEAVELLQKARSNLEEKQSDGHYVSYKIVDSFLLPERQLAGAGRYSIIGFSDGSQLYPCVTVNASYDYFVTSAINSTIIKTNGGTATARNTSYIKVGPLSLSSSKNLNLVDNRQVYKDAKVGVYMAVKPDGYSYLSSFDCGLSYNVVGEPTTPSTLSSATYGQMHGLTRYWTHNRYPFYFSVYDQYGKKYICPSQEQYPNSPPSYTDKRGTDNRFSAVVRYDNGPIASTYKDFETKPYKVRLSECTAYAKYSTPTILGTGAKYGTSNYDTYPVSELSRFADIGTLGVHVLSSNKACVFANKQLPDLITENRLKTVQVPTSVVSIVNGYSARAMTTYSDGKPISWDDVEFQNCTSTQTVGNELGEVTINGGNYSGAPALQSGMITVPARTSE